MFVFKVYAFTVTCESQQEADHGHQGQIVGESRLKHFEPLNPISKPPKIIIQRGYFCPEYEGVDEQFKTDQREPSGTNREINQKGHRRKTQEKWAVNF